MKIYKIIIVLSLTFLCSKVYSQTKQSVEPKIENKKQKDTSYWVENLKLLRNAIVTNDKKTMKDFFSFPFNNEGNEIWYLAYNDNNKLLKKLGEKTKLFTEKDFEKYYKNIFSEQFQKCFLKLKLDKILKQGESESPTIKEGRNSYKLIATYNKEDNILTLSLSINNYQKISKTEYEPYESNYIYRFGILKNGHLKLKKILIAG